MPERNEIPLELIKEFEMKLKEIGFISEQNHISSISITDIKKVKARNKPRFNVSALNTEENSKSSNSPLLALGSEECRKWKRVPKKVWDPDLRKYITIYVDVCAD